MSIQAEKIDALFISDVHLGTRGSNPDALLEVLKSYNPASLYIVGDFIDGWMLKKKHYWTQSMTNVVRKILSYSKKGTAVYYITGNHDDFLREYDFLDFGNIKVVDEILIGDTWIVHGDLYDAVVKYNKWLAVLGSVGYDLSISLNKRIAWFRRLLGLQPKSFSKWLKSKVKHAVSFVTQFEETLVKETINRDCRTVICGHIHTPADLMINGVRYINTGDWVESLSYVTLNQGVYQLHTPENVTIEKTIDCCNSNQE